MGDSQGSYGDGQLEIQGSNEGTGDQEQSALGRGIVPEASGCYQEAKQTHSEALEPRKDIPPPEGSDWKEKRLRVNSVWRYVTCGDNT